LGSGAASGSDVKFSAAAVRDAVRRLHLPLWNTLHLYTAYASADHFEPSGQDDYDFVRAYELLDEFITTLSTWYVRLLKPKLWRSGLDDNKRATYEALHAALSQLAHVSAPFLPFLAEQVHQALGGQRSIHLADWPAPCLDRGDDALVADMRRLRT